MFVMFFAKGISSSSRTSARSLPGSLICGQNKSLSTIFNQRSIRGVSTAKGLFNTKKIRRTPRISVPDDDHTKSMRNSKNEGQDDAFSDKFTKGEVSRLQVMHTIVNIIASWSLKSTLNTRYWTIRSIYELLVLELKSKCHMSLHLLNLSLTFGNQVFTRKIECTHQLRLLEHWGYRTVLCRSVLCFF